MPIERCELNGRPGWRYGQSGTCYTYAAGDEAGAQAAKQKAIAQGLAIGSGKPPAEGLADDYLSRVTLSLAEKVKPGDVIPFPLFPIGNWKSAKYPNLPLTRELAEELIANFEAGVLGTEPVLDSSGRHDTAAPAAGWFKRLHIEPTKDGGELLFGDVKLTDLGAELLNGEQYKYGSVEIDAVVDNRSGARTPNVLKSATLTNTPVLRIMPSVLEAAEQIAVALSEITPAEEPDPVQELLDDLEALAAKLDERLKGKKGMPSARAFLREVRSKVSAYALADESFVELRDELERALGRGLWVIDFGDDWVIYEEDERCYRVAYVIDETGVTFGQPVEVKRVTSYVPVTLSDGDPASAFPACSEAGSYAAKGEEGEGLRAAAGLAARKGEDHMKTVLEALKLDEGADEATVLAAVRGLIDERDGALLKLSEAEQTTRRAAVEARLAELVKGGHVSPGEKDAWLALAEAAPEQFEAMAAIAAKRKVIDLSEHGAPPATGESEPRYDNPSVELAERAKARSAKQGITFGEAMTVVLAEDKDLAARYDAFRSGKEA